MRYGKEKNSKLPSKIEDRSGSKTYTKIADKERALFTNQLQNEASPLRHKTYDANHSTFKVCAPVIQSRNNKSKTRDGNSAII